jgi:protein arginine kinase activator
MQCQVCNNNEATIHLTEISGNVRTEMHLCEYCASQQGVAVAKTQIPLNELLSGLLASVPGEDVLADSKEQKLKCPRCGFSIEQLRTEALLGCPYDYEIFEKTLAPLIQKAHDGKVQHCGKVPSRSPKDARKQIELLNLKRQLEDAVRGEDYERAARLRDKIAEQEKV